jgi:hypothetical protein
LYPQLASTDGRKRHKRGFISFSETKTELFQADAKTKLLVYEWLPDQEVKAVMIGIHGGMPRE